MNQKSYEFKRRRFLKLTSLSLAGSLINMTGFAKLLPVFKNKNIFPEIGFTQQELPYSYAALEDIIDAQTMEIHYSKHAAGYAKNLHDAYNDEHVNTKITIEQLLDDIGKYSIKMRNNAGGHFNHEMFWKCMRPKTINNVPSGELLNLIERDFSTFENFKLQFLDAGKNRFGSGWVWLLKNDKGKLLISSTANQDNPFMKIDAVEQKGYPLLCLDVWEHAYYLKYQNKRLDYISGWWNLVNWDYVSFRLISKN